jgi:hypothetical protein
MSESLRGILHGGFLFAIILFIVIEMPLTRPLEICYTATWIITISGLIAGVWGNDSLSAVPQPHELGRYRSLWEESWFQQPQSPDEAPEVEAVAAAVFPFTLSGIAEWRGRALIYLLGEKGVVYELTEGETRGDLELISAQFGQNSTGHKASVRYREAYFDLEFDLEKRFEATPSQAPSALRQPAVNVRVHPRRPDSRSPSRRRFEGRRPSKHLDQETDDWLDGWFEK